MRARAIFITTSIATLALALVLARAEPAPEMDHGKMGHGAGAMAQWADPGKTQAPASEPAKPDAAPAEAPKADAGKADEHAGHQGGASSGAGMNHGGGMMGGMMGGPGGGMGGMSHGGGGMGGMMQRMMCGFAEHLEGRLAYLKAELKLTEQQLSTWSNFADAWRVAAQKAQAKCASLDDRPDHSKPPVLHKLDMMDKHMSDHLDIVRAQKAAIEPLFTALSEEQKKIASEALTSIMKVGMSMGGGMMGGTSHGGSGGGMQH
ncbi:Spy/CpxP family protein refolding chaperone [Methylocystis sp. S23]